MHIPAYIGYQLWRRKSVGSGLPLDGVSEPSPLTHCRLTGLLSGVALWTTQTFGYFSQTAWEFRLERRQTRFSQGIINTYSLGEQYMFHYGAEKAVELPLLPGNFIKPQFFITSCGTGPIPLLSHSPPNVSASEEKAH